MKIGWAAVRDGGDEGVRWVGGQRSMTGIE